MSKELNIQQMVSYLTGNCSKKEQEQVEQWINLSDDNSVLFNEFKTVWDATAVNNEPYFIDVDKSWDDFKDRANFNKEVVVEPVVVAKSNSIKRLLYNTARIAALIVIVFGLYILFEKENNIETIYHTAEVAQIDSPMVLPDGSIVSMNEGAEIGYPESFKSDIRYLNFSGEAFFDVAHNPEKPMVIATSNVRVKVLGTSFNLCNCIDSDEITVYLESGKILFYSVDEDNGSILEQIILNPGQKGIYNKKTGLITKHQFVDNNHLAWKTGSLKFVKAPLTEVINVLERTYSINVNSSISLDNYLLTAQFDRETQDSIFESLQIIYGFNYKIDGNSVSIY